MARVIDRVIHSRYVRIGIAVAVSTGLAVYQVSIVDSESCAMQPATIALWQCAISKSADHIATSHPPRSLALGNHTTDRELANTRAQPAVAASTTASQALPFLTVIHC